MVVKKLARLMQVIRQLLFNGSVDITTALRKDGDDKCWWGP